MITPLQHLTDLYYTEQLTHAEYRDALKALYASETDVRELAKIRVQFVRVSVTLAAIEIATEDEAHE